MANLYTLIKASEKQVRKLAVRELKENGYAPIVDKDYIYAEGSVPVLLVAHYDTVLARAPKYIINTNGVLTAEGGLGADDRAGVYAILELIRNHHCSVLLTGGEERGCVGAEAFTKSGLMPSVNYIIELDRRGSNDAVYYEGDNRDFEDFITGHGWKTADGSFTDICVLAPYIGVAAVNLSIGYMNEHRASESLNTEWMNANIRRLPALFDGPKYEWKELPVYRWLDYGGYGKSSWYADQFWYVEYAGKDGSVDRDCTIGDTYYEAIGYFLCEHSDLCYDDILDCVLDNEYDWYGSDDKPKERKEDDDSILGGFLDDRLSLIEALK